MHLTLSGAPKTSVPSPTWHFALDMATLGHARVQRPTPLLLLRLRPMHFRPSPSAAAPGLAGKPSFDLQRRYARPFIRKRGHASAQHNGAFEPSVQCWLQTTAGSHASEPRIGLTKLAPMQAAYSTIAADSAGVGDGGLERWSIGNADGVTTPTSAVVGTVREAVGVDPLRRRYRAITLGLPPRPIAPPAAKWVERSPTCAW